MFANLLEDSQQGEILFKGEPVKWKGTGHNRHPADPKQVLRIRTKEALLTRLEALLERAENVEHALQVEQEIRRITEEIEGMKGRSKLLADRAALSTITIQFQPVQREDIEQSELFDLPVSWLGDLGLDRLLEFN